MAGRCHRFALIIFLSLHARIWAHNLPAKPIVASPWGNAVYLPHPTTCEKEVRMPWNRYESCPVST